MTRVPFPKYTHLHPNKKIYQTKAQHNTAPPWVEMGHAVCSEDRQAGFTVMPTIQAQGVFSIMLPLKLLLGLGS